MGQKYLALYIAYLKAEMAHPEAYLAYLLEQERREVERLRRG